MRKRPVSFERLETRELLAGSNFFVSPAGNDSAAGTAAAPWRTLQNAANRVAAGDHVNVLAGTYVGFDLRTDGTAANPITFSAQSGAIINQRNSRTPDGINLEGADYIVIEGFTVLGVDRAGIRSVTNQHVTIRNNRADQNGRWGIFTGFSDDLLIENNETSRSGAEHGIYVSNSGDRPVIRGNAIWGNFGSGIHMNGDESQGGDGIISDAIVENNVIYDNGGGSGINCDGVQDSVIRNNLLYNNHASGISLYRIDAAEGAKNNLIVNNTIVQASNGRWALNIQDASTGNRVLNNILYNNHSFRGSIDIDPAALPGFASDYNVLMNRMTNDDGDSILTLAQWRAATGQDQHSLVATPSQLFVNVAGGDYRLSATSPAVNTGTSNLAPPTDLTGVPRPTGAAWDIGAYEFSPADTTPPAVTQVRLRGSAWNAAVPSISVPLGGGGPTLPWVNLNVVEATFGENVVVSAGSLQLSGNRANYAVESFSYDAATRTARWQLATPLGNDTLSLDVAPGVVDAAGNPLAAFGPLSIRVLPGDSNADGIVSVADLRSSFAHQFSTTGESRYDQRYDVNGNGVINTADLVAARDVGMPTASSPAPALAMVVKSSLRAKRRTITADAAMTEMFAVTASRKAE